MELEVIEGLPVEVVETTNCETFAALSVEAQVALLTAAITEYVKRLLPANLKPYTPFLAMILGMLLMMFLKQSILLADIAAGFLIGFCTTGLYAIGKNIFSGKNK